MKKLIAEKINASYDNKLILKDITLEINQGEFICLCGPNGSGKSTLLSLLAGLPSPNLKINSAKTLPSIDKTLINKMSRKECAQQIAYLQQNEFSQWNFTLFDFILQGRFPYSKNGNYSKTDYEIVTQILKDLNLENFSNRNIHSLSGGEFQKARIARCLCQNPVFMILDEPASNLDYVYEPQLLSLLKDFAHKKEIGILISIHDINIANKYSDKIFLLPPQQKLISGKPSQIMTEDNLKITYGVPFECKKVESFQLSQ